MPLIDLNGLGHFKDRENAMIAENFAATKDYAAGDYCYFNGTLKKFKTAHAAGAWIGTDAEDAKLAGDVSSLKESLSTIGTYDVKKEPTIGYIKLDVGIGSTVNLTPVVNGSWSNVTTDVVAGETYIITTAGGNASRAWGLLDANNKLLSVANANTTVNQMQLVIPTNASKLVVNGQSTTIIVINRRLLDKQYVDDRTDINIPITWNDGAYVTNNGTLTTNSGWSYSDFLEIPTPVTVYLSCRFYDNAVVAMYNENKELVSAISQTYAEGPVFSDYITMPPNTKYVRLSSTKDAKERTLLYIIPKQSIINIANGVEIENSSENPIEVVTPYNGEYFKIFSNMTVIGDSYACGTFDTKINGVTGNTSKLFYSWGKYIERETGIPITLKAFAGATSKSWLTTYADSIEQGKTRGYIIALGFNDRGATFPLGTIADINDADYKLNADSFYGNYGGIIQRVLEAQPDAKIFCVTLPKYPSGTPETIGTYSEAIINIAEKFNCYVLDLYQYGYNYFEKTWFRNKYYRGHMLANGYIWAASMTMQYVSKIIEANWDDFKNVQFIGSPNEDYED